MLKLDLKSLINKTKMDPLTLQEQKEIPEVVKYIYVSVLKLRLTGMSPGNRLSPFTPPSCATSE